MELYEALKSGTSLEDLEATFRKEVKKAQERIAKEKADQEEKNGKNLKLAHQRTELAKAIVNWVALVLDEDSTNFVDTKEIEQKILEVEEDLKKISKITSNLEKIFDQIKKEKPVYVDPLSQFNMDTDDNTIQAFLKSLK